MVTDLLKDLIIVGSGPAGASAAKIAANNGLDVLLFDKEEFPRYKQCGGALGARVTNIIPAKDIEELPSVRKTHGLCMISPSQKHVAKFYREGHNGYFVSRIHFDNYLHEKALEAGAVFQQERVLTAKYIDNGIKVKTKNATYNSRLLIIANGFYSRLPAMFNFPQVTDSEYIGLSLNSESPIPEKTLDEYFGEKRLTTIFLGLAKNGYGYVFAMKNRLNIGVGGTQKYVKNIKQLYSDFVKLVKDFYGIKKLSLNKPRGYRSPFYKPMKKAFTDRVMVAGDAAWMINALTGEGVYYALVAGKFAGETAVEAINTNDSSAQFLSKYNERWMESFGHDLNKYASPLRKMFFKSNKRMELAVKMAKADEKMIKTLTETITNSITCEEGYKRILKRAPISFIKGIFS
ncbi:MAG: geranylgeranyl reductase family protein [Candidatus Heimdallarchaeota archaeon]|nr:geranylgeranyl reductase family protein [Candidatus Heimdallarchaeota archaeon]